MTPVRTTGRTTTLTRTDQLRRGDIVLRSVDGGHYDTDHQIVTVRYAERVVPDQDGDWWSVVGDVLGTAEISGTGQLVSVTLHDCAESDAWELREWITWRRCGDR